MPQNRLPPGEFDIWKERFQEASIAQAFAYGDMQGMTLHTDADYVLAARSSKESLKRSGDAVSTIIAKAGKRIERAADSSHRRVTILFQKIEERNERKYSAFDQRSELRLNGLEQKLRMLFSPSHPATLQNRA